MSHASSQTSSAIDTAAARWVARRDRALTAREQDEYLQWLSADPRHAAAIARHEAALQRMMQLSDWEPGLGAKPNPDLFAPRWRSRRWLVPLTSMAAAAVLAFSIGVWWMSPEQTPGKSTAETHLRVNERQALPDGSMVELKDGSRIEVWFTAEMRRVQLHGGEAFFTVAGNPKRPFVVEAGGVEVRAVGTRFNVRLDASAVEVLVTEGKVKVTDQAHASVDQPLLRAGERVVVPLQSDPAPVQVAHMTSDEIRTALSWQVPRLQFYETPLSVAVDEFNRNGTEEGRPRLVIGEPRLGSLRVGGTFRVDNVHGFVRLLKVTMNIRGEDRGQNEIVLVRER